MTEIIYGQSGALETLWSAPLPTAPMVSIIDEVAPLAQRPKITWQQIADAVSDNNPYGLADFESEIADRVFALVSGADQ